MSRGDSPADESAGCRSALNPAVGVEAAAHVALFRSAIPSRCRRTRRCHTDVTDCVTLGITRDHWMIWRRIPKRASDLRKRSTERKTEQGGGRVGL
jgi:hypothetical protein